MIRRSNMKEKTRWPTLDCSRSGSRAALLAICCTAMVMAGRRSACAEGDARQAEAGGGKAGCGDQRAAAQEHGVNPLKGEAAR